MAVVSNGSVEAQPFYELGVSLLQYTSRTGTHVAPREVHLAALAMCNTQVWGLAESLWGVFFLAH